VKSVIDRKSTSTTNRFRKVETTSEATMPRGIRQATRTTEQCLKVVDTISIRSSSGSRSNAFGEDKTMAELVASIASLGIIEPIVVRQVEAGAFVVVAGERRFTAAKLLNLRQVPCVVTQCSDREALEISLTENLQRSDLNPIEKACALRRLLDDFALSQQEIGQRVGMSQSAIAHHLRLLSLPREVRRLISEGSLSVGHGKVLAGINDEQKAIDAAMDCISQNRSVREFEVWLSNARGETSQRVSRASLRNKREERELRNGLFLVIKERRDKAGSGTIEIPFDSQDDKDWVLKALSEQGTKQRTSQSRAKPSVAVRILEAGGLQRPLSPAPSAISSSPVYP
jgi:ParB family transcriptional regulator, chromosome partitioning protein